VLCGDFREVLKMANRDDLIYMDPPYQGISEGRDRRYIKGVQRAEVIALLEELNRREIDYILSYDGRCGKKSYGEALPSSLRTHQVLLSVGRSSQATLNGRDDVTVESVYLSPGLSGYSSPAEVALQDFAPQIALFP
jgi:DNA adenine methylase